MANSVVCIHAWLQCVQRRLGDDKGQDLVEYAFVIAVICLGMVSGMGTLATGINSAMTVLSTSLNTALA